MTTTTDRHAVPLTSDESEAVLVSVHWLCAILVLEVDHRDLDVGRVRLKGGGGGDSQLHTYMYSVDYPSKTLTHVCSKCV